MSRKILTNEMVTSMEQMWAAEFPCSQIAVKLHKLYPEYAGHFTPGGIAGAVYRLREEGNQNFPVRMHTQRGADGRVVSSRKVGAVVVSRSEKMKRDRDRATEERRAQGIPERKVKVHKQSHPIAAVGAWKMSGEDMPPTDTRPLRSAHFKAPELVRSVLDVVYPECKWPCDTPQGIMFGCYNVRDPGSPYCAGHSRVAFRGLGTGRRF